MKQLSFRLFGLVTFLALLLTGLPGCGGFDRVRGAGPIIDANEADGLGYTVQWSHDLASPPGRVGAVSVLDDLILVAERRSSLVTAISAENGQGLWIAEVGRSDANLYQPFRDGDRIYINTDARLFTLDAETGRTLAIAELDTPVSSSPVQLGNSAIFGGSGGRVFATSLSTGRTQWRTRTAGRITASPLLVGSNIFVGDRDGRYAMFASNGETMWRGRTFGPISATAATDGQAVYVPSQDQAMYVLDAQTGDDLYSPYRATVPLTESPRLIDGTCYLPVPRNKLVAIDPASGATDWERQEPLLPLTLHGDQLVTYGPQELVLLDSQDGQVDGRTGTAPLYTVLEGPNQSIILVSYDGRLVRLNQRR